MIEKFKIITLIAIIFNIIIILLFTYNSNFGNLKSTLIKSFEDLQFLKLTNSTLVSENKHRKPFCKPVNESSFDVDSAKYKMIIDKKIYEFDEIEEEVKNVTKIKFGGSYSPKSCTPKQKIAIIIPYRDRLDNFKIFLTNINRLLIHQNITYGIYTVEPLTNLTFNRGILMNIGYVESLKDSNNTWNCFLFHDVDMIPEDFRNLYKCENDLPVQYAIAVSKFGYSTSGYFSHYFGGITAFTREQYRRINGFSNNYFGWGAEDDDLLYRTHNIYKRHHRRPGHINRYTSLDHKGQSVINEQRFSQLNEAAGKYNKIGISEGLSNLKYKVRKIEKTQLFTNFLVEHPKAKFD